MMKKRKHLHTNFINFIIEKYGRKNFNDLKSKETENEFDEIMKDNEDDRNEIQNEIDNDEDIETIDNLIKEYKLLENKYKLKSNDRIYNKRK